IGHRREGAEADRFDRRARGEGREGLGRREAALDQRSGDGGHALFALARTGPEPGVALELLDRGQARREPMLELADSHVLAATHEGSIGPRGGSGSSAKVSPTTGRSRKGGGCGGASGANWRASASGSGAASRVATTASATR